MRRLTSENMFNFHRDGCFGSFTIVGSEHQSIFYSSTIFKISEIDNLKTAKEVLSDKDIDFDAMIQRDIVPKHVVDIQDYLSKQTGTKDVRFFPPLLAALLGYRNNSLDKSYSKPIEGKEDKEDEWTLTWGDVFQCTFGLPRPEENIRTLSIVPPTELGIEGKNVIPHLSCLKINTDAARLVVVDGQHRLRAIQHLNNSDKTRKLIENISIPVCIVWAPWAYEGVPEGGPNVIECLRRIFVDVNSKAKQVSGHFNILLKDDEIVSIAIREFCEIMRKHDELQYIEWNQSADEKAYQLTWYDKVTSVGILKRCITEPGANSVGKKKDYSLMSRVFSFLLQLEEVRTELDETGNKQHNYATITNWDAEFTAGQRTHLRNQLAKYFAPCIRHLFTEIAPFKTMQSEVNKIYDDYHKKGDGEYDHAIELLKSMTEPEHKEHIALKKSVHDDIRSAITRIDSFNPYLYRTQRFQQGLFASYYIFIDLINRYNNSIMPIDATKKYISYLNKYVYMDGDKLFAVGAPWLEGVITKGGNTINTAAYSRMAVAQLLLSRLGSEAVSKDLSKLITDNPEDRKQLAEEIKTKGHEFASRYVTQYRKEARKIFVKQIDYDPSLDEATIARLQRNRDIAANKIEDSELTPEEAEYKFTEEVNKIVDRRIHPNLVRLSGILGYEPPQLSEIAMYLEDEAYYEEDDKESET